MRLLVIPDVHLKPWMFTRADEIMQAGIADNALCLGDIPDDFKCKNNMALYNETFDAAETFLRKYPESLWIVGNHDASYLWDFDQSGKAYLAETTAKERVHSLLHKICFLSDKDTAAFAMRIDKCVFSHAGIVRFFTDDLENEYQRKYPNPDVPAPDGICGKTFDKDNIDDVIWAVNSIADKWMMWTYNSPMWARPQSEYYSGKTQELIGHGEYIQVVGHSPMKEITEEKDRYGNRLISCDVFSTDRNRKPIGTEKFLLIDTVTGEWKGIK